MNPEVSKSTKTIETPFYGKTVIDQCQKIIYCSIIGFVSSMFINKCIQKIWKPWCRKITLLQCSRKRAGVKMQQPII